MHTPGANIAGYASLFGVQLVLLVTYSIFVRYDDGLLPQSKSDSFRGTEGALQDEGLKENHVASYPHFQDIHVMIFIGFGFLMTFLKRYGYSATGFTLFLASIAIQWAILFKGFLHMKNGTVKVSLDSLIDGDISAAVPLISMGVLLGRTTPIQLLFMGLVEIVVFALNEYLQLNVLWVTDVGGSITVHAFGAYFGLAISSVLRPSKDDNAAGEHENATSTSDLFAMIGTIFLWLFWPSFNSVLLDGADQERAIVNTYFSLAAATVTTFVLSAIVSHENKLDMVHVQNSTLAGGVAVGSVCNLLIGPHGAILVGIVAGTVSVCGYRYLTPFITEKLRIHDTCGVHNLHGMPAIVSAIFSAIYACLATTDKYQGKLEQIYPAMMNSTWHSNSTEIVLGGYGRTPIQQAGYQLLSIALTIVVAIIGGAVTVADDSSDQTEKAKPDKITLILDGHFNANFAPADSTPLRNVVDETFYNMSIGLRL